MDNTGHRERLKNKVFESIRDGNPFQGLHDYEVIEYFLFYIIPRKDTKQIAKSIIKEYGDFSNFLDANPSELSKIDGLGKASANIIQSFRELINYYRTQKIKINSLENLEDNLKILFANKTKEHLYLITLNESKKVISSLFIENGKSDKVIIDIEKIVRRGVSDNAKLIILAHNHPQGSANPSIQDRIKTDEIAETLKKIDIQLLDHLIITSDEVFSFAKNGLI